MTTVQPEGPSRGSADAGGDRRARRSLILLVLVVAVLAVTVWMTRDYWLGGGDPGGDPVGNMILPPPPGATLPSAPAGEDEEEPDAPATSPAGTTEPAKAPTPPAGSGAGQR